MIDVSREEFIKLRVTRHRSHVFPHLPDNAMWKVILVISGRDLEANYNPHILSRSIPMVGNLPFRVQVPYKTSEFLEHLSGERDELTLK